jgi:uncharacterized protein YaiI (UPF0178 family)
MTRQGPYTYASARFLAQGRTGDKSHRTAGQRARTDAPRRKQRPSRFGQWLSRMLRRALVNEGER